MSKEDVFRKSQRPIEPKLFGEGEGEDKNGLIAEVRDCRQRLSSCGHGIA